MPRAYPPEYRRCVLYRMESGKSVAEVAADLGVRSQTIHNCWNPHLIDTSRKAGITTAESTELAAARCRIAELETELAATKRANELLKSAVPPKAIRGRRGDGRRGSPSGGVDPVGARSSVVTQ